MITKRYNSKIKALATKDGMKCSILPDGRLSFDRQSIIDYHLRTRTARFHSEPDDTLRSYFFDNLPHFIAKFEYEDRVCIATILSVARFKTLMNLTLPCPCGDTMKCVRGYRAREEVMCWELDACLDWADFECPNCKEMWRVEASGEARRLHAGTEKSVKEEMLV